MEHNWDQRLRSALLDAARLDGEEALSALGEEPEFSPAYRAARARLLRSPFRSTAGWARRAVRWAACAGLVLCLSAGSVFLFSPSARAWAVRMWSIWHREYTEYNFHGDGTDPAPLGVWRPTYIPEGYVEWNKNETGILRSIDYVNEEDYLFSLTYMPLCENVSIMLDNEHSVFSRTTVNGLPADLYVGIEADDPSTVIWIDENNDMVFSLDGVLEKEELLRMAESIKPVS